MKNRKRKVVTTAAFMEKARDAIDAQEKYENEVGQFCIAMIEKMDEILSDGQRHQIERFMDELERSVK